MFLSRAIDQAIWWSERQGHGAVLVAVAIIACAPLACGREPNPAPPSKTNTGGAAGSVAGAGSGGAPPDLRSVAAVLDGYVMKQPCVSQSGTRACRTHPAGACPVNQDPLLVGARPTDDTLSFGGMSGTLYDVTLHVQGIVESKVYRGGADASELVTDGFLKAGTVDNQRNQASAFGLQVTSPIGFYFFNSLGRESMRHSVFAVDFEATIGIMGGTPLQAFVADPNCEALRNCGDPDVPSECTPVDVPNLEPKIRATLGTSAADYDGQFVGFAVKSVTARK